MFIVDKMFNQNQSPTDLNIDIDVAGGKREDALVIGIIALLLQNLYFSIKGRIPNRILDTIKKIILSHNRYCKTRKYDAPKIFNTFGATALESLN